MAILIETENPAELLSAIQRAIDNGTIQTWVYDRDGDFTQTLLEFYKKAWLLPKVNIVMNELKFDIVSPKTPKIDKTIYAIYNSMFVEMLLKYFSDLFSNISIKKTEQESLVENEEYIHLHTF